MSKGAALITGSGRRLGRELALSLARQGYDIAVHYMHGATNAQRTLADVQALGVKASLHQADLLDEAQCQNLVAAAAAGLGQPLTVLVNNASIFENDDINTATKESWDRALGTNLRAPFVLTQNFAAQVPPATADDNGDLQARGVVVNMLDQKIHQLTPDFISYTIAKYALWGFTQTAAQALAPHVRVNAIGPGPTVKGIRQSDQHFENQRRGAVLKRAANPADIAAALQYILAAPAVTGQFLCVDGGQHLAWKTV